MGARLALPARGKGRPCLTAGQNDAEAEVVVTNARLVPKAVRGAAVASVLDPAAAADDAAASLLSSKIERTIPSLQTARSFSTIYSCYLVGF